MDLDETWLGWSTNGPLQVLLFFGQIPPGADPGRGQNWSRGSPSSRNLFFRPEGYSDKENAKQWSRSMWKEVLLLLVPLRSQNFDAFLTSFWTSSEPLKGCLRNLVGMKCSVPYNCCFSVRSVQEQIQGVAKIGHGVPFFNELVLQSGRLQQQT